MRVPPGSGPAGAISVTPAKMRATRLFGSLARSALALAAALVLMAGGGHAAAAPPAGSASATSPAGPAATISAPTPEQIQAARDLFAAASKNEDASRWEDALGDLERVAELKPTAGVRYHIAFCEEKLGRVASALTHFREAREAAARDGSKDVLSLVDEAFLDALRARVPALTIAAPRDVPGVIVVLDGHRALPEFLGKAIPLDPGAHHLEANAPGRAAFVRDLVVHEREVTELEVQLAPTPTPTPTPSPSPSSSPAAAAIQTPTSTPPLVAPLLATTGALALVGLGVTAYVVAGNAQTTGQAACLTRATCDDLKTPVRAWDAVALGAWLGGAALAALAVVLWSRSPTSPGQTARAQVTIGATEVAVEGSF